MQLVDLRSDTVTRPKNMTGLKWPKKCGMRGCSNPAEVGAHVWYDDRRTGNHWYILPMCNSHNSNET